MDFHECLKSAIDYLEENLDDHIDYDTLARKACCSTYRFGADESLVFTPSPLRA